MVEEKIETFLTQIKSLDALALSLVEELKMAKMQNEMLTSEKESLLEDIRSLRGEINQLKEANETLKQETQQEPSTPPKPKPKKTKSKAVEPEAPTLF